MQKVNKHPTIAIIKKTNPDEFKPNMRKTPSMNSNVEIRSQ